MATDILVHTDPDPSTAGMPPVPPDELRAHEEQQLQIAILDVSEARRANARDMADARLSAETEAGGGVRGFVRKLWKGNIAHEYYRQKYTHQAMDQIDESGNLYAGQDYDSRQAVSSVVDRFTNEYAQEMLHTGERRVEVNDENDNRENPMRTVISNLIGSYARDELSEGSFEEEKNRVLKELARQNPAAFGEGMAMADNLLEVARNVKAQIAHGRGLEEIMSNAKFVVGEARMGVRTEANFNRVDRVVEKIHSTRIGSLVNETTIATAAALVAGVTKWGAQKTTGAALAATGAIGAAGAVFAGVRESKRFKQERSQHMRESAMGKAFEAEAARRGRLEQTRYGTKAATELAAGLNGLMDEQGRARHAENPDQYIDAVRRVAEAHARIKMSDREKIDLIHFSDVASVEKERFDLDLALARAKVALRHQLEERGGNEVLPSGLQTSTFDQLLSMYDGSFVQGTNAEISEKDAVFNKMRRAQVAKAAIAGAVIGSAVGVGIQEGMAHVPGIGDDYYGAGEDIDGRESGQKSTLLRGLLQGNRNTNIVAETDPLTDIRATDHVNLKLPDGFNYQAEGNTWTITSPDGETFSTIQFDDNGNITPDSVAELTGKGVNVGETLTHSELSGDVQSVKIGNDTYVIPKEYSVAPIEGSGNGWQITDQNGEPHGQFHINFDGSLTDEGKAELQEAGIQLDIAPNTVAVETTTQVTDLDANELIWYNADQTERVHRVLWYGNDTPGDYDLNELRTHAGGVDGSWFDEQGNAVLDISRMSPDGSFQGGQEANPFQLTGDNRLSLAVSVSKESQDTVFNFDFVTTPEGRTLAIIPPDSPVHQLFEIDQNGNRVFNGRYLEVMEMTGQQDEFGQEVKILSTFVGESNTDGGLTSEITEVTEATTNTNTLSFTPPVETMQEVNFAGVTLAETSNEVVPAVPVPVFARKGIESAIDRPGPPQTRRRYEYGGYGPYGEYGEDIEELIDSTIPELRENPRARVPTGRATSWYRTLLGRNRGTAYVSSINQVVANSPNLLAINNGTKAILTVPVAALTEGDNIFQSLSLYGQQPEENQASTQILLHVNWARDQAGTPDAQARINRTMDEIARAQAAYPGLNITVMQSQWSPEDMQGGVIGSVVRKMFDTAILATDQAIADGRMDPDHEVVIIRNDADAKGISRDYIGRMVDTVTRDNVDAAAGRIRWGIDQTKTLPGLALTMQVYEGIRGSAERAQAKGIDASVETIGINTGVRLSTLAAVGSIGFGSYTGAGSDDLTVGGRIKAIRSPGSYVRQELYRRQHGGRLRGWIGRRRSSYSGMVGGEPGDSTVVIAAGAMVDSDVSRLEGQYRNGESVTGAWGSYDQGGYRARNASMPADAENESLADFETIADRVQFQINSIINNWNVNPAHVEMELKRSFPSNKSGEDPMYELQIGRDGKMEFKFTASGVELLKKRSTRNNRGQFDGLGTRRVRVNYGRRPKGAALRPPSTPRLVEAQA